MSWNWKTLAIPFAIGTVVLLVGVILSTYTESVIGGIQETLRQGGLSVAQRDYFQSMLDWWTLAKITFYSPLAYLLTVIGIIIIVFSICFSLFTIWHESTSKSP
jgi:hypothetical protein